MPPPSFLEQALVMKGDSLNFISGVSKDGFPYGVRVMDLILRKMLDNDKYSQVIGVSLGDRVDSTFAPYQHLYPSKFHLLSPSVMSSEATTEETSAHIRSLLQQSPSCRVKGVLRHLQEHVIKWNPTTQQQTTPSTEDGEGSNKIAVMIYSFSELVLHVGDQQALAWLRAFSKAISTSKISTCILLHSSLHSPAFLAQIETLCNSVCHVHSTYGQFLTQRRDDSICCTTHTVRKAPSTGRVGEGTDLFTIQNRKVTPPLSPQTSCEFYELEAVVSKKHVEHDPASEVQNEDEGGEGSTGATERSANNTLENLLENTKNEDGGHTTETGKGGAATVTSANDGNNSNNNVRKEMLVVFDRSDPEFESDSDPDDDLDL